jgi:hypothetical protein
MRVMGMVNSWQVWEQASLEPPMKGRGYRFTEEASTKGVGKDE